MYQAQRDEDVGNTPECLCDPNNNVNFEDEFNKALSQAPWATPNCWVFKFDMELGTFAYTGFDSERMNGLPWADIVNFDGNLQDNCGENYSMKQVIDSSKFTQSCGYYFVLFMAILAVFLYYFIRGTTGAI
jgi:hypothetical protein